MQRYLLFISIIFLLSSCSKEVQNLPPENLLGEETYLDVYIDLHLFNAMVQAVDTVMNEDSLRLALFDHYSVTEDQFRSSHAFYQSQTLEQQARLDTAVARIARNLEILNAQRTLQPNLSGESAPAFRPQSQ